MSYNVVLTSAVCTGRKESVKGYIKGGYFCDELIIFNKYQVLMKSIAGGCLPYKLTLTSVL